MWKFHWITIASLVGALCFTSLAKYGTEVRNDKFSSCVIRFPAGSAELTGDMRKEISTFVSQAKAKTAIDEVVVAAWADHARVGEKSLTSDEQDLARRRAKNIRNYLEDELKVDADTFNMAKRSNLWSRIFNTEEARVKGKKPVGHDQVAWRIHEEGGPSAAVLVVQPTNTSRTAE